MKTKKIAVLGCSFSAFWQGDDTVQGPNYNIKTWSHLLSENFDVQVDTYAQNGSSSGFFVYCLNYILNSNNNYDLIIGNMPPLNRDWYFSWNKRNDTSDYDKLLDIDSWFEKKQLSERVFEVTSDTPTTTHSHDDICYVTYNKSLSQNEYNYVSNYTDHIKNNFLVNQRKNLQNVQIIKNLYSKQLPLVFWHHIDNAFITETNSKLSKIAQHNLNHTDLSAKAYFRKEIGDADFYKNYTVDSSHFSTYGHEQLLEKYILADSGINSILMH